MALLFHTSEKGQESILVTETNIHLSTKKHSDIESFEKSLAKKGLLETLQAYEIANIESLYHAQNSNAVTNAMNNKRYLHLEFKNAADRDSFLEYVSGLKSFNYREEAIKPFSAASVKLIAVGVSIVVTVFLVYLAQSMESGEEFDTSGRRGGLKALLKSLLELLGSAGVAVLGALATVYFAYSAFKIYKNPPNKVVYS